MKIPVNLDGIVEPKPVPAGRYDLVITAVEETKTKELGKPQLRVSIAIAGHETAPNVTHFIGLNSPGDDPNKAQFKSLMLKRFLSLFKIPNDSSGFDTDDFLGATAAAELGLSDPDESGNVYNRLFVPKMINEGSVSRPPSVKKVA